MQELDKLRKYIENYEGARILAVSKTKSVDAIREAISCGQHMFGENRVSEIVEKKEVFKEQDLHLIGHLQSNKLKQILPYVNCIESLDSLKLAKMIVAKSTKPIDVLLQLKTGSEEAKTGFTSLSELLECYEYLKDSELVTVKGIMTIATNSSNAKIVKDCFKEAYKLYFEMKKYDSNIDTLSMGMSNDYKIALDCGSNLIRIGSLIFGSRV